VIHNSGLTKISSDDLKPFPNLIELYLHKNKLTNLEGDVFKYNPKLQLISFNNNQITNIGPNIFAPMKNLREVYFSSNMCINKFSKTPADRFTLKKEIETKCPPTGEMWLNFFLKHGILQIKIAKYIRKKLIRKNIAESVAHNLKTEQLRLAQSLTIKKAEKIKYSQPFTKCSYIA
jgi:hypothetical protein